MTLNEIKEKLRNGEFETALHAFEEAVEDCLSVEKIINAIFRSGELIEIDPQRFRCLVYCKCEGLPVHVVFDYHNVAANISSVIEIITIYRPHPAKWINYRIRRR